MNIDKILVTALDLENFYTQCRLISEKSDEYPPDFIINELCRINLSIADISEELKQHNLSLETFDEFTCKTLSSEEYKQLQEFQIQGAEFAWHELERNLIDYHNKNMIGSYKPYKENTEKEFNESMITMASIDEQLELLLEEQNTMPTDAINKKLTELSLKAKKMIDKLEGF